MKFTEIELYYLEKAFISAELKSDALKLIGRDLANKELNDIDLIPQKLIPHINIGALEQNVIKYIFNKKFVQTNLSNKFIRKYFIDKLSDYANFNKEYRKVHWSQYKENVLIYKDEHITHFNHEYGRNVLYYIAKTCAYNPKYETAKEVMNNIGIKPFGGTCADYIESTFFQFKEHALSIMDKLSDV